MRQRISLLFCFMVLTIATWAQSYPYFEPEAEYVTSEGEVRTELEGAESAPLKAKFTSNVKDLGDWKVMYTWTITNMQNMKEIRRGRQDEPDMEYTFANSGSFRVRLNATFVKDGDPLSPIEYPDLGQEQEADFFINIQKSKLELPNAFSPNGDGYNDVFRVKDGFQSIVDFEARIFNRWGQCLYTWTNIRDGWDGRYNGSVVSDGTYYVVVKALGADGKKYNLRRDVNVLTTNKKQDRTH